MAFGARAWLIAATLFVAGAACAPHPAAGQSTSSQVLEFNIGAQPLDSALVQFSQLTGKQILGDSNLIAGLRTSGVQGRMVVQQALLTLLAGTNLRARFTAGGSIVIAPSGSPDIVLDQLDAVASPILAPRQIDPAWVAYADRVQRNIRGVISDDAELTEGDYEISLALWLDGDGRVTRAEIITGSGNAGRDSRLVGVVRAVRLDDAPPATLPFPIRVQFRVR